MTELHRKVLLVGYFGPGALECSYAAAFRDLGCDVSCFNIADTVQRYCRGSKLGRLFNRFVPVEPWIRKANRELVLMAREFGPDLLIVFGQNPVRAGVLAQIRSMFPVQMAYIWPDTLINLSEASIACLPLYDLVATYGRGTVEPFHQLGALNVMWVPLAGDPHLVEDLSSLPENKRRTFRADISFIGQWRPEREEVMQVVLDNFGDKSVKIWGLDWGRRCRGKTNILKAWQGRALYDKEYHAVLAESHISLNIIDDTNYPAANMRLFEIPMASGVQVCSPCPEMEDEFKHGETIFYYHTLHELVDLLRNLLANDPLCQQVARHAYELVTHRHTYRHRAQKIIEQIHSDNI